MYTHKSLNKMKLRINMFAPRCTAWVVHNCHRILIVSKYVKTHPGQLRLQKNKNRSLEYRIFCRIKKGDVLSLTRCSRDTFLRTYFPDYCCVTQNYRYLRHEPWTIRCHRVISICKHRKCSQTRTTHASYTNPFRRVYVVCDSLQKCLPMSHGRGMAMAHARSKGIRHYRHQYQTPTKA